MGQQGGPMTQKSESQPRIPNKQYYRIGEVSRIVGVPTYVLRFWETEFKRIKPRRTATGQRIYHRSDLTLILKIKSLLYDRQFTIKGARKHLSTKTEQPPSTVDSEKIAQIRSELQQIRDLLK
jgi:DNA-binding transcriptional MerR regulator